MEETPVNKHPLPSDGAFVPDTELNIEAILEEIKNEREESCAVQDAPPGTVHLDEDVVLQMVLAVQELTQEVKQLRSEISSRSCDAPSNPLAESCGRSIQVTKAKEKEKKTTSVIGNVLFYAMLIALVFGAFLLRSNSTGGPFTFAGYSAFTVLSSSMEDTYPKGSLVVTKAVDANTLQIGDDITFMISEKSSVTHRIVSIVENYQNTGQRAFETKGTMNQDPDKDPAIAANVVGKVIFCSILLGQAAAFVTKNWPFMLFFVIVIAGLIAFLKWNMRRPTEKTAHQSHTASVQESASEEIQVVLETVEK
ncbi:MAG: signal peptidase I [Oscillospiraceae bacterium]|nr:signal peptidase I [Oscillospiraceae bacterium]